MYARVTLEHICNCGHTSKGCITVIPLHKEAWFKTTVLPKEDRCSKCDGIVDRVVVSVVIEGSQDE